MEVPRYLEAAIHGDLSEKMVFVAGPRQVGKSTLAHRILARSGTGLYLSWDSREDRSEIRSGRWPGGEALVVLDELHRWQQSAPSPRGAKFRVTAVRHQRHRQVIERLHQHLAHPGVPGGPAGRAIQNRC